MLITLQSNWSGNWDWVGCKAGNRGTNVKERQSWVTTGLVVAVASPLQSTLARTGAHKLFGDENDFPHITMEG